MVLAAPSNPGDAPRKARSPGPPNLSWIAVFSAIAIAIAIAAYAMYSGYERQFRASVKGELQAIGELMAAQASKVRADWLEDAEVALGGRMLGAAAIAAISGDPGGKAEFARCVERIVGGEYAACYLVRVDGTEVGKVPESAISLESELRLESVRAAYAERPYIRDFFRIAGREWIAVVVPLRDPARDGRALSAGFAFILVDPEYELFTLLDSWPGESASAEALIAWRSGGVSAFASRRPGVAAKGPRAPFSAAAGTPPALAAAGNEGFFTAVDRKGNRVFVDSRRIPDSPWYLTTKRDEAEVLAPLRERLTISAALGFSIIACVGVLFALLWRRQRYRAYRELYEAERESAWLTRVVERSLNEIYAIEPDSLSIRFANEGAIRNSGYSAEDFGNLRLCDLAPALDAEAVRRELGPLAPDSPDEALLRTSFRRKDGSEYPAEAHLQLVDSGGDRVLLAFVSDVTERDEREKELRERNEELSRFTYTVSHDLRSPLVTIRAFLGYLTKDIEAGDTGRIEADMGFIANAADKMARLLEELLNLSRIGRKSAPFTRSTLGELSQEAIRLLAGRIDARGVKVEVRNGAESMYGDRNRLVELLQNLIDNAVKYSGDQAYPKVVVGVERPELRKKGTRPRDGAPDRERVFYVRDNGMGIDPRHSGKLFGLFEKLVPGTEGTGVGLAVVKRIVELHGGRVWAESEGPGKGSCFKFTLAESAARKGEDA